MGTGYRAMATWTFAEYPAAGAPDGVPRSDAGLSAKMPFDRDQPFESPR